jgi:predicted GH43/DUF377 family glycosyl hydrolase
MKCKRSPLKRYSGNPIITNKNVPFPCYTVMNSGAVRFGDKYLLLLRIEDMSRKSYGVVATSDDGFNFTVHDEPINYPLRDIEKIYPSQRFDYRITPLDGTYYVCHALWLDGLGCTLAMAKTFDFVNFYPVGQNTMPSNRNGALFPEKINGKYCRLERPEGSENSGIMWVNSSPDLIHWGNPRPIATPAVQWNHIKSGAGCVPIKTEKGWLEIYHGVAFTCSSNNYYLGAMLLDLDDPSKVIAAPTEILLAAEEDYECVGQTPNVVFTGGAIETDDGNLNIYYGGADTRMCVAQATVDDLLDFCLTENRMDKKIVKKPIPGRAILDIAQQHSTRNIGLLTEVKLENI